MNLPPKTILFDSLGDIKQDNTYPILVCGSHCGGNRDLAKHIKSCHIKAVFLNNAGIGKNEAGVRGITHYNAEGIIACAVDRNSAEIGIAQDTWNSGIISHVSPKAETAGIKIGQSVQEAVAIILPSMEMATPIVKVEDATEDKDNNAKVDLKKQEQTQVAGVDITVADSITFLNEDNAGDIVVCGSHGGMSAGHYAQKHNVKAVFFNDAGIGKNDAGTKSLTSLNEAGVLAGTVDCMTAEIFNGQDVLNNGIISVCNPLAQAKGIKPGMTIKEAITLI